MNYDPIKAPQINARLVPLWGLTFSSKILRPRPPTFLSKRQRRTKGDPGVYVRYLKYDALAFICTESEPTA